MKFSLEWLGDFVDTAAAGGADGARALLDRAGIPIESVETRGADAILEAEITPNRPDAMGHRGLAREIAAMAGIPMKEFAARYAEPDAAGEATEQVASIVLQVPSLCRRFGARMVRGIERRPASERVRGRLAAIGAKSISAAVDATNYVLWDTGQPLHAFDFDKLSGGLLIIRKARKGERLVTLDGVERVLESTDVVVADAQRPVSLAGIMGGLDTAVTDATTNVLLEAAWWDPATVRRTARRLGMHTDASHRFERSADIDAIPGALNLAARLLVESSGGTVAPGLLDVHGKLFRIRRTALRLSRLRLLSGDSRLGLDFAEEALGRLGFTHERKGKRLSVTIPLFRTDVRREDDLVEEVLRVYGYDRLPSRLPAATGAGEVKEPRRGVEDRLSDAAAAAGLFETVNYPFVDRDGEEAPFGDWLRLTDTALEPLALVNPLDASRRHLRATLLPGLLDAAARNLRHGARESALFEVGRAFGSRGESDKPESYESRRSRSHWPATVARTGACPRSCGPPISSTPRASPRPCSPRGRRRRSSCGGPCASRRSPRARPRPWRRGRESCSGSPGSSRGRSGNGGASRRPCSRASFSWMPSRSTRGRSASRSTPRCRRSARTSPLRSPRISPGRSSRSSCAPPRSRTSSRSRASTATRGPGSRRGR